MDISNQCFSRDLVFGLREPFIPPPTASPETALNVNSLNY